MVETKEVERCAQSRLFNHYDVAVLIAGDRDYVPLVEEIKRAGKGVVVSFFEGPESGLDAHLRLASDSFLSLVRGARDLKPMVGPAGLNHRHEKEP